MPKITLNGKAPVPPKPATAVKRPVAPSRLPKDFAETLQNAIANGTMMDPALLAAASQNPGVLGGSAQNVAVNNIQGLFRQAVRDLRSGALQSPSVGQAQRSIANFQGVAGGQAPQIVGAMDRALQRVLNTAQNRFGSRSTGFTSDGFSNSSRGTAMTLYQTPRGGVPAIFGSPRTGFTMGRPGGGNQVALTGQNTSVSKALDEISRNTAGSLKIEGESWNQQKTLRLTGPTSMPRAPGAWLNVKQGPATPAFVPPGSTLPPRFTPPPAAPWFVPPGAQVPGGAVWGPGPQPGPGRGGAGGGGNSPNPPGGGGGGGGGRGGGGGIRRAGRGYGWGKAVSRVPYVGGAISNIVEAGALGGPEAAAVAAAIEGAEAVAFHKQMWGDIAGGVQAHAALFMGTQADAFAAGRAGGFSGREGLKPFFDGLNTPGLMKAFGATPQDAMRDLKQFGIVQGSPEDRASLFQQLNVPQYSPGFSGLDQNQVKGSAANAARYGIIEGRGSAGVAQYFQTLGVVMEGATARGMDRASILRSIDASMSGAARGGAAGVSLEATSDFIGRFANLPGGRTGEIGLSASAALDNAASQVGHNPSQSLAYSMAARRVNSQTDLEGLLGRPLTETQQDTARYYFMAKKSGNMGLAGSYLAALTKGNDNAVYKVLAGPGSPVSTLPEMYRPIATAGITGMGVNESIQAGLHPHSVITPTMSQPGVAGGSGLGATPAHWFSENKSAAGGEYEQALTRMGVRRDLIPILIEEGRKAGINPLLAGATMMGESHGGNNQAAGVNVMQVKGSSGLVRRGSDITSARQSIALGYQVEKTMLARGGGDVTKMHAGYEGPDWGTAKNAPYENAIRNAYIQAGVGPDSKIPDDANQLNAGAGAATTRGSQASLDQNMIERVNTGLDKAGTALEKFAAATDKATKSQDWYREQTPLGGALGSIP